MKYIYTAYPPTVVLEACENTLATEVMCGRYFRYEIMDDDSLLTGFIYKAIIAALCGERKSYAYVKKLSEFLLMTGYNHLIYKVIYDIVAESDTIHIDGIINFRLQKLAGDIKAFFELMHYAKIIIRGYENLGGSTIKFLEF